MKVFPLTEFLAFAEKYGFTHDDLLDAVFPQLTSDNFPPMNDLFNAQGVANDMLLQFARGHSNPAEEWMIKPAGDRAGPVKERPGNFAVSHYLESTFATSPSGGGSLTSLQAFNGWLRSNGVKMGGDYFVGAIRAWGVGFAIIIDLP